MAAFDFKRTQYRILGKGELVNVQFPILIRSDGN